MSRPRGSNKSQKRKDLVQRLAELAQEQPKGYDHDPDIFTEADAIETLAVPGWPDCDIWLVIYNRMAAGKDLTERLRDLAIIYYRWGYRWSNDRDPLSDRVTMKDALEMIS